MNKKKVLSFQDYYPFGMLEPNRNFDASSYAFGYQSSLKDNELYGQGNSYATKNRLLNTQRGQWNTPDKLFKKYPSWSPYNSMFDNPIWHNDQTGNGPGDLNSMWSPLLGVTTAKVINYLDGIGVIIFGGGTQQNGSKRTAEHTMTFNFSKFHKTTEFVDWVSDKPDAKNPDLPIPLLKDPTGKRKMNKDKSSSTNTKNSDTTISVTLKEGEWYAPNHTMTLSKTKARKMLKKSNGTEPIVKYNKHK